MEQLELIFPNIHPVRNIPEHVIYNLSKTLSLNTLNIVQENSF